jgi:hypothetical protein
MSRSVGQIAFGVIGGIVGGPIGFSVGNMLGAAVFGTQAPPASLQKLRLPQTQVGTMLPIIYGGVLPGEVASDTVRGGVRTAGVWIDCDKKGGITQKGGKSSGGTTGAPNADEAPQYYLTAAMAVADARGAPVIIDQIFFNDKCKFDRFGKGDKKGWKVLPEYDAQGNIIAEIGDKIEMFRGTWKQQPSAVLQALHSPAPVPAYRGISYIVFNQVKIKSIPTVTVVGRNNITGARVIVTIHLRLATMPAERIDLCEMKDHVRGAFQNNEGPARALCEQLARFCYCDLAEWDGKVKDVSRIFKGVPPNATAFKVPAEWLAARESNGGGANGSGASGGGRAPSRFSQSEEPDHALHSRFSIAFSDIERNWDSNEAPASRHLATHNNPGSTEVGIVATMKEMLPRARIMLDEEWAERYTPAVDVPMALLRYAPGAVVEVPAATEDDPDATQIMRLTRQSLGLTLHWEGTSYDASVYENHADVVIAPGGGSGGGFSEVSHFPAPRLMIFDPPIMAGENPDANASGARPGRFLVAAGMDDGTSEAGGVEAIGEWGGAVVIWNPNGSQPHINNFGDTGMDKRVEIAEAATMGITQTALTYGCNSFDYGRTLRVRLFDPASALGSASEAEVLSGANRALLQNDDNVYRNGGRFVQWTTATQITPGVYDLTGLLVGRFATGYITSTPIGADFLLLNDETGASAPGVERVRVPRALLDRTLPVVVASGEEDGERGAIEYTVCTGNSQRPPAATLAGSARLENGDRVLSWRAGTRDIEAGALYWSSGVAPESIDPLPAAARVFTVSLKNALGVELGTREVDSTAPGVTVDGVTTVTFTAAEIAGWYGSADAAAQGTIVQHSADPRRIGFPLRFANL